MKLAQVQVRKFRNIIDSGPFEIQPDITCLVGKNESGKTTCLHALYRLRPARPNVSFSIPDHYPAWLEKRDRMSGAELEKVRPITAIFEFEQKDIEMLEKTFGEGIIRKFQIEISRDYAGKTWHLVDVDEGKFVSHILRLVGLPRGTITRSKSIKTISQLKAFIEELSREGEEDLERPEVATELARLLNETISDLELSKAVWNEINRLLPKFIYFSEYSTLPYSVDIRYLLTTDPSGLKDDELTALSLLRMAAADNEYLTNPDYERRKRELENVANTLTDDVVKYWSQNPELRVQPDITQKNNNYIPRPASRSRRVEDKDMGSAPFLISSIQ